MKTILLGTDFMYNNNGDLVPIQINTAVTQNITDRIEDKDFIFDLSELRNIIIENKFSSIFYIGSLEYFNEKLSELCDELDISNFYYKIGHPIVTVPSIEDKSDSLIIRSAYDTNAIVDDEYCRNRSNFLNLIKYNNYNTNFCCVDYAGKIINTIEKIPDNGNHPNFILKSVYPDYDRNIYPKLFKASNQFELNKLMENVNPNYFLTPFYFNENKLYKDYITNFRSMNILLPPDLKSISIGTYTKICEEKCNVVPEYDNLELKKEYKKSYLTTDDYNINIENNNKKYIFEKVITSEEIKNMNDILSSVGKTILDKHS